MSFLIVFIIFLNIIPRITCFWPPPYKVNLEQEETFVISELVEDDDINDVYKEEEEIIKREDLEKSHFNLNNDDKYYRLHRNVRKQNVIPQTTPKNDKIIKKNDEFNPDVDDPLPWEAGFVYEDEYKKYNKEKRNSDNYDYSQLKNEYNENIKIAQRSNKTLNYTDIKENESAKEAVNNLLNFKQIPKNCTEEETKGIGIGAIECIWIDMKKPRIQNKKYWLLEKLIRIVLVWLIIYIVVAIPLWCQYGWCCCCCRCEFCHPSEQIDEIKKFFVDNPLGVYHDNNGTRITYRPTNYERYAHKNLEHAIMNL